MIRLMLIVIALSSFKSYSQNDVRNVKWGWSKAQVKAAEKKAKYLKNSPNTLEYKTVIDGSNFLLDYEFVKNKLYQVICYYNDFHISGGRYIEEYNNIQKSLKAKYNEPRESEPEWKSSTYKNDPEKFEFAFMIGDVILESRWEMLDTRIRLKCYSEGFKTYLYISYIGKDLIEEAAAEQEKDEDGF